MGSCRTVSECIEAARQHPRELTPRLRELLSQLPPGILLEAIPYPAAAKTSAALAAYIEELILLDLVSRHPPPALSTARVHQLSQYLVSLKPAEPKRDPVIHLLALSPDGLRSLRTILHGQSESLALQIAVSLLAGGPHRPHCTADDLARARELALGSYLKLRGLPDGHTLHPDPLPVLRTETALAPKIHELLASAAEQSLPLHPLDLEVYCHHAHISCGAIGMRELLGWARSPSPAVAGSARPALYSLLTLPDESGLWRAEYLAGGTQLAIADAADASVPLSRRVSALTLIAAVALRIKSGSEAKAKEIHQSLRASLESRQPAQLGRVALPALILRSGTRPQAIEHCERAIGSEPMDIERLWTATLGAIALLEQAIDARPKASSPEAEWAAEFIIRVFRALSPTLLDDPEWRARTHQAGEAYERFAGSDLGFSTASKPTTSALAGTALILHDLRVLGHAEARKLEQELTRQAESVPGPAELARIETERLQRAWQTLVSLS